MDKKRIMKTALAVGFVIVCGGLYLLFCSPFGASDEIVLEQQTEHPQAELVAKAEEASDTLPEETTADDGTGNNEPELLYVHICGAVSEEGVYALPAESRVTDGIEAAGGFSEGADETFHNLAALLTDGQKIYVPTLEETRSLSLTERTDGTGSSLYGATEAYGSGAVKKVNLNTAGLAELMTLSGIGEAKAESILKYREKVGRFLNIEELKKVSGIGDALFERIREDIVVE